MPENNLTLLEFSKNFRTFYQKKYDELAEKIETPDYFADKVQKNYIYKGAAIAKNARKLLKTHNNFAEIINNLPDEGALCVQNCGQGEFALMAALVKKRLQITATDNDIDLLEIAKNCASVPANLLFLEKITNFETFDTVIDLKKILH